MEGEHAFSGSPGDHVATVKANSILPGNPGNRNPRYVEAQDERRHGSLTQVLVLIMCKTSRWLSGSFYMGMTNDSNTADPSPDASSAPSADLSPIVELLAVMTALRDPLLGCPWDRAQDFASIVPHTLEEAYEVADVIEAAKWEDLKGELGDLLFQIVFYSEMARERGWFGFSDVAAAIVAKLKARHPHVFNRNKDVEPSQAPPDWEAIKAEARAERGQGGALQGVAAALPALSRANKLQSRATRVGFDWPNAEPVYQKVLEELDEIRAAENVAQVTAEVGDLLFASVNLARHLGVNAESALRSANRRFERRFAHIEAALAAAGREPASASLAELDELWGEAKTAERESQLRDDIAPGRKPDPGNQT